KDRSFEEMEATSKKFLTWSMNADGDRNIDVYCTDLAFSPDGRRVAGTSGVGRLDTGGERLWGVEAATGKEGWLGKANGMLCVTYAADGKAIITGSGDGTLRVWHPDTGRLVRAWHGHRKAVRQVAPLQGALFVSAGEDGKVAAWDAGSGKPTVRFATGD